MMGPALAVQPPAEWASPSNWEVSILSKLFRAVDLTCPSSFDLSDLLCLFRDFKIRRIEI